MALIARTFSIVLVLSGCITQAFSNGAEMPKDQWPFKGKLWRSLLYERYAPVTPAVGDSAEYSAFSPKTKSRLEEYAERLDRFHSRLGNPPGSDQFELTVLFHIRVGIERGIVALVSKPGIEDAAAQFADRTRLFYEWEGMSDGPLTEAADAEYFLTSDSETPLKPFLFLFLLHRYRCAYECLVYEKNMEQAKKTAETYHALLVQARLQTDPLAVLAVDDLERETGNIYQDSRYTMGPVHP
jgi:hypothetical protein